MKIFKTFQELIDYIPSCVICHKIMGISIDGYLKPIYTIESPSHRRTEHLNFMLKYKDGILTSKCKNHTIAIEAATNKLIEGEETINKLMNDFINIKKSCSTCVFKILSIYMDGNVKKTQYFPPIKLQSEELAYTMTGGKRVTLLKYTDIDKDHKCMIEYNNRYVSPIALDFSKFTDLNQISRKIKTIITFQ